MDPNDEMIFDIDPVIKIYRSGRVERFLGTGFVPPATDPATGISVKDVTITPNVSARLYLPKLDSDEKVPVLLYYHGGAFCLGSVFDSRWHNMIASLVSKAKVVAVSVQYRLAPEHPLPAAYEDSFAALDWVTSHAKGRPESWISDHGNLNRVFLLGDSAGGNMVHHVMMYGGAKIHGAVLVQPYFLSSKPVKSEMIDPVSTEKAKSLWKVVCPKTSGLDDPLLNPFAEEASSLVELGCERVLVMVAELDTLRDRGQEYYQNLKESGWKGEVKFWEAAGEGHGFHMWKPESEMSVVQSQIIADFLNEV